MRKYRLIAVLLLLCLFAQALGHARSASIVFDEGPHLAIGYATLRTGDFRLQPVHIHPPLANALAAAPLLLQNDLPDPHAVSGWEIASLSAISDAVVWQYPRPREMALASRFPIILMTMLLGAVVFCWAADLFGPRAGLLALGLYACDPNIIAHGSLVTTDMAVVLWGTAALFLMARYLRRSRWKYLVGAGITLGLALASKVSAVSLVLPIGLLCLLGPRSFPWQRRFLAAAGCIALAALTLWAVYGFEVRPLPGFPWPVPAATHVEIYLSLQEHYELGHSAFLMGQNSEHGWWYYFPVAFVLKTPLPTMLLLVIAIACCVSRIAHCKFRIHLPAQAGNLKSKIINWGPPLLFPAFYIASSFFSSVNIGYRHLLPVLPFLFIFISWLANHVSRFTSHVLRLAFYALLASYPIIVLCTFPHYLTYFNLLAGGPAGGYRYLVDSNLDWGQNLWQLRDWMQENDVERVYYAHYSPARPQVYGVEVDFLPPDPRAVSFTPFDPAPGVYAIGATVLQGAYTPDVNTYAWFRTHEPLSRLGHALFVYEVPPRPRPAWAAICANPGPVIGPETVRANVGRPDLRVILFDCAQAWVYPATGGPGIYVLPSGAVPPADATLEAQARHPDGQPTYTVYRVTGPPSPARTIDVDIDGPLDFLGYEPACDSCGVYPGDTLVVNTFWQVKETPGRLLSLMAHFVSEDGTLIATGDGLGVPIEQWRSGDVIVQRHTLAVTRDTPSGGVYIGAYWLDTLERWSVRLADGPVSDQIPVGSFVVLH